jgi:hypothetical protein
MFGIKENQIDEERLIFLQLWIDVVRDEGDWKSGRSLILIFGFVHFVSVNMNGVGGRAVLVLIYKASEK